GVVGARDAEIAELYLAVEAYENVRRRNVAVHDGAGAPIASEAMGVVEAPERFRHHEEGELDREGNALVRRAAEELAEVEAFDILHRDEERAVFAPEVFHLDDVDVVQARGELRFGDEELGEARAMRERREDLLHDHEARRAEARLLL